MSDAITKYFEWSMVDGVVLIVVTRRELSRKEAAEEWGEELKALIPNRPSKRYVIDFRNTDHISSTAYSIVILFSRTLAKTGGSLAICGLKPEVRAYAEVLKMGRIVPIHDDLNQALAAFA